MSKVSFRARQIDFNRPLPILKNDSDLLSEFNENALVNRGVPQIPSGMEKEEENEHHFVEVIHALQLRDDSDVKIPVPDIIDRSHFYQQTYPDFFSLPKHLVHIRTSLFAENDDPEYDMDSEDEEWLNKSRLGIAPGKFESMIDRLERGCGQRVMNLEEAKCLLQEDPSLAIAVYDYWLSKRVQSRQPLLYAVRQEKRDNTSGCDPYIAFRRRSEKMQTRKNRKNDEQSYEKMLILRSQMEILGEILTRLIRRESTKSSILQCEQRSFETRFQLSDWDGSQLADAELLTRKPLKADNSLQDSETAKITGKRSARKRKLTQRALDSSLRTQSSDDVSDTERSRVDEPFAFVRLPGCRYLKPRNAGDWEEHSKARHPHLLYSLTTVPIVCNPTQRTYTGYIRRRLGRGGRIVCDRLETSPNPSYHPSDHARHPIMQAISNPAPITSVPSRSPGDSTDEALIRRLRPVVMSNHPSQPSLRWPICTKFSSSPFEPLKFSNGGYHPLYISEESSLREKCPQPVRNPPTSSEFTCQVSPESHHPHCSDAPTHKASSLPMNTDYSATKVLPAATPTDVVLPIENCKSAGKLLPRTTWHYDPPDGHNLAECPKSRDTDLSKICPNGLSPVRSQSSDDRLLRKDTSVLPSKLYRVTQNCVSMDSAISGAQLQATNGITSTQFCQLPT